jgi:hypothetical protein
MRGIEKIMGENLGISKKNYGFMYEMETNKNEQMQLESIMEKNN